MSKLFHVLTAATLVAVSSSASAAPIIFSGFDAGNANPGPNATAAALAFNAAVPGTSLETFEGFASGANTNGLVGPGYSLTSVGFNIQNTPTCAPPLCGDNTTPAGRLFAYSNAASASLTFNFTTPINAFGAYFGGLQTSSNALVWSAGSTNYSVPLNPQANGGFAFVGFYDAAATTSSVTIDIPFDLISVDDVRFGAAATGGVPEPSTWAMLIFGFGIVGSSLRAKRTRLRMSVA